MVFCLTAGALLKTLPGFVAVFSGPESVVEYGNELFFTSIGRVAMDVLGRPAAEAVPETADCFRSLVREVRSTGGPIRLRGLRVQIGKEPKTVIVDATCSPMHAQDGTFAGVLLHGNDVTEFQNALDHFVSLDERKEKFLSILAHELRGPLAMMNTAGEVLARHSQSQSPILQRLSATLKRESTVAAGLINDLNDLNAVRLGKAKVSIQRGLVYQDLINQSIDSCHCLFEQKGQTFSKLLPGSPIFVDVDPLRIGQVIRNLLGNAAKYTPAGGRIQLKLQASSGSDACILKVTDDGMGIPTAALEKIFDLYHQEEGGPGNRSVGLGIGLNLVRELVRLHGGQVSALSDGPGKGSSFSVRLPLSPARAREDSGVIESPPAHLVSPEDQIAVH